MFDHHENEKKDIIENVQSLRCKNFQRIGGGSQGNRGKILFMIP